MRMLKRLGLAAVIAAGTAFVAARLDALRRVRVAVTRLRHRRQLPRSYDDATLTSKVETELFRPADAPKGQVSVSVAGGVVTLRGELDSGELIRDLIRRTRQIQGVQGVENLLHLPGTQAPMHQ
jgi:osmotically-inducible protein OsmY